MGKVFFLLSISIISISVSSSSLAQEESLLHQGIYTEAQASRGQSAYMSTCASCHANDLRGNSNSPGLIGVGFLFLWEGRPLAELFDKMSSEMPTDRPGSLATEVYLELLAFILQKNGYPAGAGELTEVATDDASILIVAAP